ncbi:hypothetical protein WN48_03608 [Eufriesea mexicana]|nr:hypothetical protein WN48_03608 [Eufriesea mexicana]
MSCIDKVSVCYLQKHFPHKSAPSLKEETILEPFYLFLKQCRELDTDQLYSNQKRHIMTRLQPKKGTLYGIF